MIKSFDFYGREITFKINNAEEHQQRHWLSGMFYEAQRRGLVAYLWHHRRKYMKSVAIDIGASLGNHTVFLAKVLACDVLAIEPVKSSFDHMVENVKLNNVLHRVYTYNYALGAETKSVSMKNFSKGRRNEGNFLVVEGDDVKMKRFDDLVLNRKIVKLIKIDVEGYNVPLLEGATSLKNMKADVFIECETVAQLKSTDRIMREYGYTRERTVKLNHTPTYLWTK